VLHADCAARRLCCPATVLPAEVVRAEVVRASPGDLIV